MDIPVKYIMHGSQEECKALKGQSRRVLFILESMMRAGNLQQQVIRFTPYPGALIVANKFFGTRIVDIYAGVPPPQVETATIRRCFCVAHFAIGIVVKTYPPEPVIGEEAYEANLAAYQEALLTTRFMYDVDICYGDAYIPVKDVVDPNFGRYYPGQLVLVTIGAEMEEWEIPMDCVKYCLISNPLFEVLSISPLHVTDWMREWIFEDKEIF